MTYEFKNRIKIDDTIRDIKRLAGKEWPMMLATYIAEMAADADEGLTLHTRNKFDLHSEYIPKGIRSTPSNPEQIKKVANSLAKYYDGFGAVYLRGSSDPKKSLSFMADHDRGMKRDPQNVWRSAHGKFIATPASGLKSKSFRTQSGKVKQRYKPSTLLERFSQSGSRYERGTTLTDKYPGRQSRNKARLPGKVFLIRGRNSGYPIAVRRISRGSGENKGQLETLYTLHNSADIKGGYWQAEDTVIRIARRSHRRIATFTSNRLAARFK